VRADPASCPKSAVDQHFFRPVAIEESPLILRFTGSYVRRSVRSPGKIELGGDPLGVAQRIVRGVRVDPANQR